MRSKIYLGDSVYASTDALGRVVLTTENGLPDDPSNKIVLEAEVLSAFWLWLQSGSE